MKRDGMRRLRAHGRNMSARAVPELLPDPIGGPAGSQLKDRSARSSVTDRTKAGPGAVWTPRLARREAPAALRKESGHHRFALFGAPSPFTGE